MLRFGVWSGVVFLLPALVIAQDQTSVDLLKSIDVAKHRVRGNWTRTESALQVTASDTASLCAVPYELGNQYELTWEFTREQGEDVVGMILPLGDRQVLLELSGWQGAAHGLSRINQRPTRDEANPTRVAPGTLKNGKRYKVVVNVKRQQTSIMIKVTLDEKTLIDYSGKPSDIDANIAIKTDNNLRPVLVSSRGEVVFHSLTVRHPKGLGKSVSINVSQGNTPPMATTMRAPSSTRPIPRSGGTVDLTKVAFQNGKGRTGIVTVDGEDVARIEGTEAVALLPGVTLEDGVIEAELSSDTFSGIAFRAADVDNYEVIYFRPQNSGTAKHINTVQYVSKGVDGADWATLRRRFPGKYEAGAKIQPKKWFTARIVIEGAKASVFVNNEKTPALVVETLLGNRAKGGIGIWGWNTNFRTFSFQPAK